MARRKQQEGTGETGEVTEMQHPEAPVQEAETNADQAVTQPEAEPEPQTQRRPYNPVRSWSTRFVEPVRYQKLTDDRLKKILFRFTLPEGQGKPAEEVLEVMRSHKQSPEGQSTGLKFEDTRTHGKVWTIPNDIEGRALAEKIDYELSKLAKRMEAAEHSPG